MTSHRQRITTAYGLTIGVVSAFAFTFALTGQWLGFGFVAFALVVNVWAYIAQVRRWRSVSWCGERGTERRHL